MACPTLSLPSPSLHTQHTTVKIFRKATFFLGSTSNILSPENFVGSFRCRPTRVIWRPTEQEMPSFNFPLLRYQTPCERVSMALNREVMLHTTHTGTPSHLHTFISTSHIHNTHTGTASQIHALTPPTLAPSHSHTGTLPRLLTPSHPHSGDPPGEMTSPGLVFTSSCCPSRWSTTNSHPQRASLRDTVFFMIRSIPDRLKWAWSISCRITMTSPASPSGCD